MQHLFIRLLLFLVLMPVKALIGQNVLVYTEDFENGPGAFILNNGQFGANTGPNQWIINNSYDGLGIAPSTPEQNNTSTGDISGDGCGK